VRRNYSTHVVALERYGEFFDHPATIPLQPSDRLWIVGTPSTASRLR
jgi:K+/H+ antiporter YhaU regulatory subunit KhtT